MDNSGFVNIARSGAIYRKYIGMDAHEIYVQVDFGEEQLTNEILLH